jgi:predicted RNase H-like HicB family nuclease
MMAGYIALLHKDEGTSYGMSFPEMPGCISAGDTFEEAVANAAEALAAPAICRGRRTCPVLGGRL